MGLAIIIIMFSLIGISILSDLLFLSFADQGPVVKLLKVRPTCTLPTYAHPDDAGADLYAAEDTVLYNGEAKVVPCGFAMELPPSWEAQVRPRSGLARKNGVTVLNSPGTIDCSYRGEVGALLINHSAQKLEIKTGDRIAQMVISRVPRPTLTECALSPSPRGEGGWGSTGK